MEKKEFIEETYMKTEKKCIKKVYYCDECGKRLATDLPTASSSTNRKYKNVVFYEINYTFDHYFERQATDDYCEECAKNKVESLFKECKSAHRDMDNYSFSVEPVMVRDFGEDVKF